MDYTRSEAKAWAGKTFHGFFEAPFTPIDANGEIDAKQLQENIDRYIDLGVDGLVVGGFIAELWTMTYQDWLRYHQLVAQAVRGRVPLFTIILESSAKQAIEKLAFVQKLGSDGAEIIVVPRDRERSNAQLSGLDPGWFQHEVRERTKHCDFPGPVLRRIAAPDVRLKRYVTHSIERRVEWLVRRKLDAAGSGPHSDHPAAQAGIEKEPRSHPHGF